MTNIIKEIFYIVLNSTDEDLEKWGIAISESDTGKLDKVENSFCSSLGEDQRRLYDKLEHLAGLNRLNECEQRFEQGFRIGFCLAQQLKQKMK